MTGEHDGRLAEAISSELGACRKRGIEKLDVSTHNQAPVLTPELQRLADEYMTARGHTAHGRISQLKYLLREAITAFTAENEMDAQLITALFFGDSRNRVTKSAGELLDIAQRKHGYDNDTRFRLARQQAIDNFADFILRFVALAAQDTGNGHTASDNQDQPDLLLRVYIPSERLYADEANKMMSLFRDWLAVTRGHGIRQTGYRTSSGEMYEFFAEAAGTEPDLNKQFDIFSNFLMLCSENPSAAIDALTATKVQRGSSTDIVARFGREVRRLLVDLRHERESRILTLRHNLEEILLEEDVELRDMPSSEIDAFLESLVPRPYAQTPLALLGSSWAYKQAPAVTLNINQQVIRAMESTIIQNVQGTVHLGPEAKDILALIDRFGASEAIALKSAVHEVEDPDAPRADRSAAKVKLKQFLRKLSGAVEEVALNVLEKYLESKAGIPRG